MQKRLGIAAALLLWGACAQAADFQLRVEVTTDKYIDPVKALLGEWYPKINTILFGENTPLPFKDVNVVFEPTIWTSKAPDRKVVPAYTKGNVIHVNADYLTYIPDDYHAMMIHELAHVNQGYRDLPQFQWLIEGIADYVRHKYYEKDIVPRLPLDAGGNLKGYPDKEKLAKQGYLYGYTIVSPFLYWLEVKKDPKIVFVINRALRDNKYSNDLFRERGGAPLDTLWGEFMAQSRP